MSKAESAPTISSESISFLEDVKKGKPRKFAMICKGMNIVSLVVYKKGTVEKRKKEAKESGKGQFYFGVVDGKGMDIRFALARADGFEDAPVKTTVLRSLLADSAQLKCKPYFEIVDAAPLVLDEDDPIVIGFRELQPAALSACDRHPDRAAEIKSLCMQIGGHLDQDQSDEAVAKISQLKTLLSGLGDSGAAESPTPGPTESSATTSTLEAKLVEALKKIKPRLEKAIELHPDRRTELLTSIAKIRDEIKGKQLKQAQSDIIALGELLPTLLAATPSPSPASTEPAPSSDTVLQRLKAIAPAIKTALAGSDAARIKGLVDAVKGQVASKNFLQAGKALEQLESLLATTPSTESDAPGESEPVSLVQLGKARLEWDNVRLHAVREFRRLQEILQVHYGRDSAAQATRAAAFKRLDAMITTLDEELGDRLDELLNAEVETRSRVAVAAKAVLSRFVNFVETDRLMSLIDNNEYAEDMRVAEPLRSKLREISAILT